MSYFDNDIYDNIELESMKSLAYDELNQRINEYNQAMDKNKDDDAVIEAKKEQQKKRNRIFLIIIIVFFTVFTSFLIYVEVNFDRLADKYNIRTSNTSKGHKNDTSRIIQCIIMPIVPYIITLILLGIVIIFIYYFVKAKKHPKSIDDYLKINEIEDESLIQDGFTPQNFHPESFANPNQKPSPYFTPNNYTSEIMVFLQSTDPTFDSIEFIEWSKKSFKTFWDAWTAGSIEDARIFLSDDLFEKMRSLLEDNLEKNRRDIYKIFSLLGCFLNKYERESGFEYLTVYLTSVYRHYVLDSRRNSNIPIEGDASEDLKTVYQLKFTRRFSVDQKTHINNGIQTVICPNCGAEVTALNAGYCGFCGSVIKVSEFSWVLSDIDEYFRNSTPVDNRGVVIHSVNF